MGLCEGSGDAAIWCKTFFSDYVDNSVRRTKVLGSEEYVDKRMLNCASSVLAMWRKVVKEADITVLKVKREQEPIHAEKWRLRFFGHTSRTLKFSLSSYDTSVVSFCCKLIEEALSNLYH